MTRSPDNTVPRLVNSGLNDHTNKPGSCILFALLSLCWFDLHASSP